VQRVVYDGDFGIDDSMALLVLAAHPDVELVAVGSVHGNTAAPQAAANATTVLDLAGLDDVPVAVGAERPLGRSREISGLVHGSDGLGGRARPPERPPVTVPAAVQLVDAVRADPGGCTVVATGPLTNLALAVLLDPEVVELVDRVVVMGGTLRAPGNITPWAEANIANDPEAADLVLGAGFPLTLVGLDVTMTAWLGPDEQALIADHGGERARFIWSVLSHYLGFYESRHGRRACPLHDPTAAVLATDPHLARYLDAPVGVELAPSATRGMLLVDQRAFAAAERGTTPPPVQLAVELDSPAVVERVVAALLT
jgi:purine nucleosidase